MCDIRAKGGARHMNLGLLRSEEMTKDEGLDLNWDLDWGNWGVFVEWASENV